MQCSTIILAVLTDQTLTRDVRVWSARLELHPPEIHINHTSPTLLQAEAGLGGLESERGLI